MRLFKKFSIISPCNNEEENIEKFISEIDTLKKNHDFNLTLLSEHSIKHIEQSILHNLDLSISLFII